VATRHAIRRGVRAVRAVGGALVVDEMILLVVVVDVQTEAGRVDAAVAPDEESAEDGFGEEVKDYMDGQLSPNP